MKKLSFNRTQLLKAIRFCFLLLAFASIQAKVLAQSLEVNGNTVPAPFIGATGAKYDIKAPSDIILGATLINLTGGSGKIEIQAASELLSTSGSAIYFLHGSSYEITNSGYLGTTGPGAYNSSISNWYDGAKLTLNNQGQIYGTYSGVYNYDGTAIITNSGSINSANNGILSVYGPLTLNNSGSIHGDAIGIYASDSVVGLTNSGSIDGGDYGINIGGLNSVSITNLIGGEINGTTSAGIIIISSADSASTVSILNAGTISGGQNAVDVSLGSYLGSNASLTVENSGVLNASDYGIKAVVKSSYNGPTDFGDALVNISNSGSIYSDDNGMDVLALSQGVGNASAVLSNSGSIVVGANGTAIDLEARSFYGAGNASVQVTNTASLYLDGDYGIKATSTSGYDDLTGSGSATSTIVNSGAVFAEISGLTAASRAGGYGDATTSVSNTGYITSGETGISASSESGYGSATTVITNSALIASVNATGLDATATTLHGSGNASSSISNTGSVYAQDGPAVSALATGADLAGTGNSVATITNSGEARGYAGGLVASALASGSGSATAKIVNSSSGYASAFTDSISASAYSTSGSAFAEVINQGFMFGGSGIKAVAEGDAASVTTVNNSGFVLGLYDNGITAAGSGQVNVINTGIIYTQGVGILIDGSASSTVTLAGGAIYSYDQAVLGDGNTEVTVIGRSDLYNVLDGGGGSSVLVLKLAGMTAEEKAILAAANPNADSVVIGGRTYTWQNFAGLVNESVSLKDVVSGEFKSLAGAIDKNAGNLDNKFDDIFVGAIEGDANQLLASLSGKQFLNARSDLALSMATYLGTASMDRGYQLAAGMEGFTSTGLHLQDASLLASLGNINTQLDTMMAAQTLSDSTRAPYALKQEPDHRWGTWISGTVLVSDQDSHDTTTGYDGTTVSPTLGIDYQLTRNLSVGVLGNYSNSRLKFDDNSELAADTGMVGTYASFAKDSWYSTGILAGGYTSYQNKREILGDTAESSPDGTLLTASLAGGYNFKVKDWTLAPELGVQYTRLMVNGYTEHGAGAFNLTVEDQDTDSLRSQVGFRINRTFDLDWIKLSPSMRASWYHEFLDDSRGVDSSLDGVGSFSVQTDDPERDFALLGVGISGTFTESDAITLFLNYNTQVGQQSYISHSINAGFRVGF